jgi:hypothetical protein
VGKYRLFSTQKQLAKNEQTGIYKQSLKLSKMECLQKNLLADSFRCIARILQFLQINLFGLVIFLTSQT